MKKQKYLFIPILFISLVLLFISCKEDVLTPPGIDNAAPEITSIESSKTKIAAGTSLDLTVEALNGDSYSWSAASGSFSAPNAASTSWTSDDYESTTTVKLICTVTNTDGSREASVLISAVVLTDPLAYWTFDSDKNDIVGGVAAVGDGVTITTDAKTGAGAAAFPGGEDVENQLLVPDGGLPTDAESEYTIMAWIKTDSLGYCVFSTTIDGVWAWGDENEAAMKTWVIFLDYGEPSNVVMAGIWNPTDIWNEPGDWTDGEWHHYALTHSGADEYAIYVDGELVGEGTGGDSPYGPGATTPDEGSVFTIGGGGWGQILDGTMDEFKYYDVVIDEAEIALLADQ